MQFRLVLFVLLLTTLFTLPDVKAETVPTDLEIEIHILVNEERETNSFKIEQLLKLHSKLIEIARAHSKDMLDNNFFAHENLNGETPAERASKSGVEWVLVAENLYTSTGISSSNIAETAVSGWISSRGHYENMLSDTSYTGVGVASKGSTYYITQIFVEASLEHMQKIGVIYDNDNLTPVKQSGINQTIVIFSISVLVILIGIDAGRRNKEFLRRRK